MGAAGASKGIGAAAPLPLWRRPYAGDVPVRSRVFGLLYQ